MHAQFRTIFLCIGLLLASSFPHAGLRSAGKLGDRRGIGFECRSSSADELDDPFGQGDGFDQNPSLERSSGGWRRTGGRSPWGNAKPGGRSPLADNDEGIPDLDSILDSGIAYSKRKDGSYVPAGMTVREGMDLRDVMPPDLYAELFPEQEDGGDLGR